MVVQSQGNESQNLDESSITKLKDPESPAQARSTPLEEIYKPLHPKLGEIRLLRVKGSSDANRIVDCTLETASLYSFPVPQYEAISYCWGKVKQHGQVRLCGVVVNMPASAVRVLRRFRHEDADRVFWIDAICINQADDAEKARQVMLMDQVYRKTSRCLIWLGETGPEGKQVVDYIHTISNDLYEEVVRATKNFETQFPSGFKYSPLSQPLFEGGSDGDAILNFYKFFESPWFGRLWVLQEAVLPPIAECYWGEWSVSWSDVRRAAKWALKEAEREPNLVTSTKCGNNHWTGFSLPTNAEVLINMLFGDDSKRYPLSLPLLLTYSARLEATDERDKFYGVFGLIANRPDWMKVDYTRSIAQVSGDFTRAAMVQCRSLEILCVVDQYSMHDHDLRSLEKPSWVYSLQQKVPMLRRYQTLSNCMCADRDFLATDDVPFPDENSLFIRGHNLSKVARIITGKVVDNHDAEDQGLALGTMLNETLEYLLDSKKPQDVAMWLLILLASAQFEMPNIQTEGEIIDFAKAFVAFCFESHYGLGSIAFGATSKTAHDDLFRLIFKYVWRSCGGRRFFLTRDGRIGLGHESLLRDDCVAALYGSRYPVILRPAREEIKANQSNGADTIVREGYQFVGLAYIPGIMYGEAVDALESAGHNTQTFSIW